MYNTVRGFPIRNAAPPLPQRHWANKKVILAKGNPFLNVLRIILSACVAFCNIFIINEAEDKELVLFSVLPCLDGECHDLLCDECLQKQVVWKWTAALLGSAHLGKSCWHTVFARSSARITVGRTIWRTYCTRYGTATWFGIQSVSFGLHYHEELHNYVFRENVWKDERLIICSSYNRKISIR